MISQTMLKLELNYTLTTCQGCGGGRQVAHPCPYCKRKPSRHEVDQTVLSRRKRIEIFRAQRRPGRRVATDVGTLDRVDLLMKRVIKGIGDWAVRGQRLEALLRAFEELDSLVEAWPPDALPRPHRAQSRNVSKLLRNCRQAMDLFVEAAYVETMDQAQALEIEANRYLSDTDLEEVPRDFTWADAAKEAVRRVGVPSMGLTTLDQELARSIAAGGTERYPNGAGIQLFLLEVAAGHVFDRVNVELLKLETSRIIARRMSGFKDLATPAWRAEAVRSGRLSVSAWRTLARTIDSDPDDLEVADALLGLVTASREVMLRFALCSLLALNGENWATLQTKTSGFIIKTASDAFPQLQLEDSGRQLRHAAAHGAFDVTGSHVVVRLDGGGSQPYTHDEFIDHCLMAVEIAWSIHGALFLEATRSGEEWPIVPGQRQEDQQAAVELIFGLSGVDCVRIDWTTDGLQVEARGEPASWANLVAAVSPLMPESANTAVVRSIVDAQEIVVSADLAPMRAFLERDGDSTFDVDSQLLVRALLGITVNGATQVPDDWWMGLISHAANWRDGDMIAAQTKRLLAIRALVAMHADAKVNAFFAQPRSADAVGRVGWRMLLRQARMGLLRFRSAA